MGRFLIVLISGAAVVILTLLRWYAVALGIGVAVGAIFFLRGMAAGGGISTARMSGGKTADMNSRLGLCLAASGIAAEAIGHDPPFPLSFRLFYATIMGLAVLASVILAWRAPRSR